MMSATHISFGVLLAEFVFTSMGVEPKIPALVMSGLGALLPDIDTPRSSVGRFFPFSGTIERKFGHRQITHSWIFILVCMGVFAPVFLVFGAMVYSGIIIGVFSHVMIDMSNPSGVPLLYPDPSRFVLPARRSSRIEVNSKKEHVLLVMLLILTALFTPLSFMGYKSFFNRLSQNTRGVVEEAKKFSDGYSLKVRVDGIWRHSQVRVDDEFRVLAVLNSGLVVESRDGKTYLISWQHYSAIIVRKINIIQRDKIEKRVVQKKYSHCLFDSMDIPENSIVSGYMFYDGYENIKDIIWSFSDAEYQTLRVDPDHTNKLILKYCPDSFLRKLKYRGMFVIYADLTITQFTGGPSCANTP
jgi:membrane-bound metal-dependent hydrolase YbcI (DUF457 family)